MHILIWLALAAYCVFAARHCRAEQKKQQVGIVEITMQDTLGAVDAELVRSWVDMAGIALEGQSLEAINVRQIRDTIMAHPFVSAATVYTEQAGVVHIRARQRRVVMRLAGLPTGDVYIAEDATRMPVEEVEVQDVPIVTGITPEQEKNLLFLRNLINFVEFISRDELWAREITQVVVGEPTVPWGAPEIELVVRSGRFVVRVGELEDIDGKMHRVALMYRNVLPWEGWDTYAVLDARYAGQIVCNS